MTAHRRENFGEPIKNICKAVKKVADQYRNEVTFVYPVHLNPNIRDCVHSILGKINNFKLIEPLDYYDFIDMRSVRFSIGWYTTSQRWIYKHYNSHIIDFLQGTTPPMDYEDAVDNGN